jgi:P27 family predicted phage terminase small subunit
MRRLGVLKRIDRGVLATWVEAEARHRTATMMQAKLDTGSATPLLVKQKDGPLVVSPYIGILHKTALIMMKAASELGFSPASRPRLRWRKSRRDEDDPWAGLQVITGGKA